MNERNEIWITGLGMISAIGNNMNECLASLRSDTTGIRKIQQLETLHKKEFVAGEISLSNKEIAEPLEVDSHLPRTTLLALHAAKETLEDAEYAEIPRPKTGVILGTTVGGMDKTERLYVQEKPPADYLKSHHCGYTTKYVADYFGIHEYTNTISTACSSAANAIMLGARLIQHGILDSVLAGGTDALSSFTLNGFRSLMILDPEPCRPFSEDRKGLNLGEGAGFVFLESSQSAKKRNKTGYCKLSGYGNSNDAFHQTASSDDGRGPYKAMQEALHTACLNPEDIDYINAHGTGTGNNDLTEGIAIQKLFKERIPEFSSTKTFTGHCLGAAGGIEAVISASAIMHNEIYANLRFSRPVSEMEELRPVSKHTSANVNHVLSNSFGFGGCDTSLLFSGI